MTVVSEFVEVNGVRLHLLRAGHGDRAIVFTHGNSHCSGIWLPLMEALADPRYTLVAWDLRGHGWSDKPEDGYTWAHLRDDLAGLVKTLDLGDVLYVGHSRGGGVTLLGAAETADRARGVFVYEPTVPVRRGESGAPEPAPVPERITAMAERSQRRRESFPSREAFADRYRAQAAFSGWREDFFQAFVTYACTPNEDGSVQLCIPARVVVKLYEATYGFDAWNGVRCESVPVLTMYGDRSGRMQPGQDPTAGIRTMFPHCDLRVMAGGTHTGPMEQPELFERTLRHSAETLGW